MNNQGFAGTLKKIDNGLFAFVKVTCITLLALIVLTISASVTTRFIFFYPLNFADALAKYMMMWMVFLGSGLAVKAGEHILVDMFINMFNDKVKRVFIIIANILVSVFLLIIIYYGFINAWNGRDVHDPFVFGVSMIIPYLSVPVGCLYILIQLNLVIFTTALSDKKKVIGI